MVVKMMRWRPWPPLVTKKYEVRLAVRRLEGLDLVREGSPAINNKGERFTVEIRWKGPKATLLRRTVKRNFTKETEGFDPNGVVSWDDEEFQNLCNLSAYKDNVFHPWEIGFTVFSNGLIEGSKNKVSIVGTGNLNLAEHAAVTNQTEFDLAIPLTRPAGVAEPHPLLLISLTLLELRGAQVNADAGQRSVVPVLSPLRSGESASSEKDEVSAIKAGLRKVKIFTEYVYLRKAKKACREEDGSSVRSEDGEYNYPFDSDSLDEFEERESDDASKENLSVRKSFSYGTLAHANCAGRSFYSNVKTNGEDEDWLYYSNRKSDVGCSHNELAAPSTLVEPSVVLSSKRSILPWKKRKLSFRSPKDRGEPLLKKDYGEEGGDDIDFDRRQLSSDESLNLGWTKSEDTSANRSSVSEFGDDNFAVGSWEKKDVISRDGHMKLETQVFFASIDQRSERAAGESACTALVAVIADWFQNNRTHMPIKSQFDSLIRDGSLEWRNLCENEIYRERFPDKHFDLETVIQAKIRPLTVIPEKSFIGFFHPEEIDEGRFDFLKGAMSFDNIWDEITRDPPSNNGDPHIYVVSWNDHFFVLKVDQDAYYIIDTLGERLFEGCNQAYILKFDKDTLIHKVPEVVESSDGKDCANPSEEQKEEEEVVCGGKESCKEYIKSFLAAIPIRELQTDIKKGLMSSTPLYQRLQIEFHYTNFSEPALEVLPAEITPEAVGHAALEGYPEEMMPESVEGAALEFFPAEITRESVELQANKLDE